MKWLLKGGRVLDPASKTDEEKDVLIDGATIVRAGRRLESPKGTKVLDARGLAVVPGLVDMHCHLREPGQEYKETVASGGAAAVKGGITSLMCMANTHPPNDCGSVTAHILERAREARLARVYPVGCITKDMKGETLSEMAELASAGCVAVSDDGRPVVNGEVMRRALEYAPAFGLLVIDHAEDLAITGEGVLHEGWVATRLGLAGIPAASEAAGIARDIALLREFGGRLHVAHVSARAAVDLVRAAKAEGLSVTAETCPHYFTLTHEAALGFDTNTKVKPPLRTADDVQAVIEGLRDGTIDVIATDHAPHHADEKDVEYDIAAFGISGLETALALTLALVRGGKLGLLEALGKWTASPAAIAGLSGGRITEGGPADLAVVDLDREWVVDPARLLSKGKNTPFAGMTLTGEVAATFVGGRLVYDREKGIVK